MRPSRPYDLREFRKRCESVIGLRLLELLAEDRHTADDIKRILQQEADAGKLRYRGRPVRTDRQTFSFWTSEDRKPAQGRLHGYRAYEDANGIWHVEARGEPPTRPERYTI
ncbi:MAG: hypothetical protein FJX75_12565 [Armatimonadetes bacterium]|nr:hypothetical protein [Armatimonadota bacterium]